MSETPIYDGLVEELGDPEQISREFSEWVIMWHAERMRERAPGGCLRGRHGSPLST